MSNAPVFDVEMLGDLLQKALHDHDFKVPVRVAVVDGTGAAIVGIWETEHGTEGLVFRSTAQPVNGTAFWPPINIMYADREGHALHVTLKTGTKIPKLRLVR